MLEPYWQNTYLASRVSFPNYKFDYLATIDLQKKQVAKVGGMQKLGNGYVGV